MAVAQRASQASAPSAQNTGAVHPVARLAALHAEAQETAKLANLLGRSIHAAFAIPLMGAIALIFGNIGTPASVTWAAFVLTAAGTIALAYRRAIRQPFERPALKSFSHDLHAILLFAGFAWGAGAFLVLPASATMTTIILFSAGACAVIAFLLRDLRSTFLFLAPVVALSSFACVLRPLNGGALDAAAALIACCLVAALAIAATRVAARDTQMPELAGLPQA